VAKERMIIITSRHRVETESMVGKETKTQHAGLAPGANARGTVEVSRQWGSRDGRGIRAVGLKGVSGDQGVGHILVRHPRRPPPQVVEDSNPRGHWRRHCRNSSGPSATAPPNVHPLSPPPPNSNPNPTPTLPFPTMPPLLHPLLQLPPLLRPPTRSPPRRPVTVFLILNLLIFILYLFFFFVFNLFLFILYLFLLISTAPPSCPSPPAYSPGTPSPPCPPPPSDSAVAWDSSVPPTVPLPRGACLLWPQVHCCSCRHTHHGVLCAATGVTTQGPSPSPSPSPSPPAPPPPPLPPPPHSLTLCLALRTPGKIVKRGKSELRCCMWELGLLRLQTVPRLSPQDSCSAAGPTALAVAPSASVSGISSKQLPQYEQQNEH